MQTNEQGTIKNKAICEQKINTASDWTVLRKWHMHGVNIFLHTKILDPKLGDFNLTANTAAMI